MQRCDFFRLDQRSLHVLELLETPMHIYSFSTQRIVWANRAGLKFWNAESLTELQARDLALFSNTTSARQEDYLAAFRRGERRKESWTFYPQGIAVAVLAHCRGVSLSGHDEAMLSEIQALDPIKVPFYETPAIMSNVDELHKVETESELAPKVERSESELQSRILEIASHEFRTYLSVIDGAAQRIARQAEKIQPAHIPELATRIRSFVSRLNILLDHAMERARNNPASMRVELVPGRIQEVVLEVVRTFSESTEIEIADEICNIPEIWFDPVRIERVLINLVTNSIKYSIGRARIRFSAVIGADDLELYVRDWGIGILPEEREEVFAERTRGANLAQLPGSGLGLYIARKIIRAHGGEISVEETSGPGTTLRIVLPLGQPGSQPASQEVIGN